MNRIAVVTGAGSGVGKAVVEKLAAEGWDVALIGRRLQLLEEVAQATRTRGRLLPVACDVANEAEVKTMAQRVQDELGAPSVLVNSAGTNVARRALQHVSNDDYRHVVDVNLNGAFYCIQAFLPSMRTARNGTIVNIISDGGIMANAVSGAAYIASKFGLTGLTATVNVEERNSGIRACALLPGPINTPLLDKRPSPPPPEARQKMLQPEDVADCVMLAINLPHRATVEQLLVMPREK